MKNSIKIFSEHSIPTQISIPYRELSLSEYIYNQIEPDDKEILKADIINKCESIFGAEYFFKIDLYAYKEKGMLFFSPVKLDIESESIEIDQRFVDAFKSYLDKYFRYKLKNIKNDNIAIPKFLYKHNLSSKCKEVIKHVRTWNRKSLAILSEMNDEPMINSIKLYTESRAEHMLVYSVLKNPLEFYKYVALDGLDYELRMFYLLEMSKKFREVGKRRLETIFRMQLYFSIRDGFNFELKMHLKNELLVGVQKTWLKPMKNVLNKVEKNESEEITLLKHRWPLFPENEELSLTKQISISSYDNIVNFRSSEFVYSNIDDSNTYFTDLVKIELNVTSPNTEFISLTGDIEILVLKKLKKGKNIINVIGKEGKISRAILKSNNKFCNCIVQEVKLVKIMNEFRYQIKDIELSGDKAILKLKYSMWSAKKPKIFAIQRDLQVIFKENNLCEVIFNIVPKNEIFCEIKDGAYKRYFISIELGNVTIE